MSNGQASLKPTLSFCAIVKDEYINLPRCLASVQRFVDEIIVVDTGSEDGTPEIAAHYGAKVSYFSWCDDFAAARNHAISQASSDWILMLDADEELIVEKDFRSCIALQPEALVYLLELTNVNDDGSSQDNLTSLRTYRLFRNTSALRYKGCFHEQLMYDNHPIDSSIVKSLESVRILHYGYSTKKVLQKATDRNIPILERLQQKQILSFMLLTYLASLYEATKEVAKAQKLYSEAFDRLLPNLLDGNLPEEINFVPVLLHKLGWQALDQEDYETSRLISQRGLEWFPNFPPLNHLTGSILGILGFPLGAVPYFKYCLQVGREGNYYKGEPFEVDFMTTHPAFSLGCAYVELKHWQEAADAFNLALSFDPNHAPAQERLVSIQLFLP